MPSNSNAMKILDLTIDGHEEQIDSFSPIEIRNSLGELLRRVHENEKDIIGITFRGKLRACLVNPKRLNDPNNTAIQFLNTRLTTEELDNFLTLFQNGSPSISQLDNSNLTLTFTIPIGKLREREDNEQ